MGELGGCGAAAAAASHTLLLAASTGGADAWTDILLGAVRKHTKLMRNAAEIALNSFVS